MRPETPHHPTGRTRAVRCLCRGLVRRCHEFRTYRLRNVVRQDPVDLLHCRVVQRPSIDPIDWRELVRPARAPQRESGTLLVEDPAHREMDDAPSKIMLRETVERLRGVEILN